MKIRINGRIVNGEPRLPSRIAAKRLILDGKGPGEKRGHSDF
jgi:hypothetical protein